MVEPTEYGFFFFNVLIETGLKSKHFSYPLLWCPNNGILAKALQIIEAAFELINPPPESDNCTGQTYVST